METSELKQSIETLLFITDHPVPMPKLAQILGAEEALIAPALEDLRREYEEHGGVRILEIAGGFQMSTRPEFAPFVRKLYADKMTMRLSTAALETLSIIAYRQPITRAEIEDIRGVDVIAALETLLDKRLIKVSGRRESVGRPLLYATTPDFLRHFGLKSIEEMPPLESFQPAAPQQPSEAVSVASAPVTDDASAQASEPVAEAAAAAIDDARPAGDAPASSDAVDPESPDISNQ